MDHTVARSINVNNRNFTLQHPIPAAENYCNKTLAASGRLARLLEFNLTDRH
jgi:hypothetical protein